MPDMHAVLSLLAQINAQLTAIEAAQVGGRTLSARRMLDEVDLSLSELEERFPGIGAQDSLLDRLAAPLLARRRSIALSSPLGSWAENDAESDDRA